MKRSLRVYLTAICLFGGTLPTGGCALLIAAAAGGGVAGTTASLQESRQHHHAPMTYAGTVLANVVWVPAKVVFAGAGAATSGLSYIVTLGRPEPTITIWNASVKGNYVLTPAMIEGKAWTHFVGA